MEFGTLNVTFRTAKGKSETRKLRKLGQIPAIVYGQGQEPVLVALDPLALTKSLDPEKRANTVINLNLAGGPTGSASQVTVMLRDWQRDMLRGNVTHADFVRVDLKKDVHAVVPLVIVGKAEGVKAGGTLHQVVRQLAVACTPDRIPIKIEVNVEKLNMGEALHVRDLSLGEGVRALVDGGQTVCTVTIPKAEKVAATEVVEGAEAAPAEGAAKAAAGKAEAGKPAAGKAEAGKPAAGKPAAAKPEAAKGGDKKK